MLVTQAPRGRGGIPQESRAPRRAEISELWIHQENPFQQRNWRAIKGPDVNFWPSYICKNTHTIMHTYNYARVHACPLFMSISFSLSVRVDVHLWWFHMFASKHLDVQVCVVSWLGCFGNILRSSPVGWSGKSAVYFWSLSWFPQQLHYFTGPLEGCRPPPSLRCHY